MSNPHEVLGVLEVMLARPSAPIGARLQQVLRLLCKYRSEQLTEELARSGQPVVQAGPFAKMVFPQAAEGCFVPKILGVYEQELHDTVEQLVTRGYDTLLNIGCAEGYYAVGLARRMPALSVYAFDIDKNAQRACRQLADANAVGERITIEGRFAPERFTDYDKQRVCVLCDIEGAEMSLLDPQKTPALARYDLLIEVHDDLVDGCSDAMRSRFASTHEITAIAQGPRVVPGSQTLNGLSQLDRLLAVWEWRLQGNGWMWLTSKAQAAVIAS